MKNRSSVLKFLVVILGSICLQALAGKIVVAEQPNILWISAEDISPHFGCYGDESAITPNIDGLALEGVRYTHAFTTAGVCAPCRSAIITSIYQSTLGTHHMRCNANVPTFVKPFPVHLRKAGYYCTNNSKQDYQFKTPEGVWDQSNKKAHWKNRPDKTQPFFAVFNFGGCHESGIASAEKYKSVTKNLADDQRQDASRLTLPPYYPDTPLVREDWKRNYELITAMDIWAGELIQELKDEGVYENTIIMFWSDHGVGLPRAKRWLYDSGTRIPLIVRIPKAMRVDGQAEPGTTSDELVSSLDFGSTVLGLAGVKVPSLHQGRAFLGKHRSHPRDYVFGARDRMDERYDIIRSVRDKRFRYIRNYEPFKPYYQFMNTPEKGVTMQELRRVHAANELPDAAKFFMAKEKPTEELYDLQADPHEINNLAGKAELHQVLHRMRRVHLQWVIDTKDIGLIPESEIVRREKIYGTRYEILRNSKPQSIQRIRDVANFAIGDKENFKKLNAALTDPDAVVRYWAAIGIGNMPSVASSAKVGLLRAIEDEAPCVRIASARALIKLDEIEPALKVLKSELQGDSEWARLRAVIALDEAGELARPLIPDLQACLKRQPNKYITRVANRTLNVLLGTNNAVK